MTPPPAEANGADRLVPELASQTGLAGRKESLLRLLITLALAAVGLGWLFSYFGLEGMLSIGLVALGLSFLIFIHELGHFLVAKWCDVHVETFSIGFGPAIPGCSFQRGETLYKIAWFPLGGYVKMVGEGAESDESDDDPRSFKNKSVGQRMAIISAGVIMNALTGLVCFIVVYMAHGVEQQTAVIDKVEAGAPTWQKGLPSGAVLRQIGDIKDPYFEDLRYQVAFSSHGEKVKFVYELPDKPGKLEKVEIEPRRAADSIQPIIGIVPAQRLMLPARRRKGSPIVSPHSPAAKAEPPFEPGDIIVGTTDPDNNAESYDPHKTKPLPRDPRNRERDQPDYFEFRRRLRQLVGKPVIIQVRRQAAGPDGPAVPIEVGPAYHWTLGMRMRMGQIVAVREGSPATKAVREGSPDGELGVRPADSTQGVEGDLIDQVEVTQADGSRTIYATSRNKPLPSDAKVLDLDPVKLPYELERWAARKQGERKVTLTVLRQVGHAERKPVELVAEWDDSWKNDDEISLNRTSPRSIAGLGLAYRIETVVEGVDPASPAEQAGLKRGDLIRGVRFSLLNKDSGQSEPYKWSELKSDQWANVFYELQLMDSKDVSLRVERDKQIEEKELTAQEDTTWPLADRGLILTPDTRMQKANNLWQAVDLGMVRTYRSILEICLTLRGIANRRISPEGVSGPLVIAAVAYGSASKGTFFFLLFLGMISINLAVINFLPIPILDGGHMVFLVYEKVRGIPASETVRLIATYCGLAIILGLVVFVFRNDIVHLFW
jgi:regulator of sigma E protease